MFVIGTAGHVDHGKSSLVNLLSGIDPDRWQEEKDRGMTIDLGFAWFTLPSGNEVSVIDVPGHEKFVNHMLAGVGGIDLALMIIAADESIMPQTLEHCSILRAFGINEGIIVVSKKDLVDNDWLNFATEEIKSHLTEKKFFVDSPILSISIKDDLSVDNLKKVIDEKIEHIKKSMLKESFEEDQPKEIIDNENVDEKPKQEIKIEQSLFVKFLNWIRGNE